MKSNKGYSLIFVIITTSLVGILIATLMHLSIVNVKMKEVNRKSEKNFYRTESVLDQYTKDLEQFSAEMMKKAYSETLEEYSAIANDSNRDLLNQIAGLYLTYLVTGGPEATDRGLSDTDIKTVDNTHYFPDHKDQCFADYSILNIDPSAISSNPLVLPNASRYASGIVSYGDSMDLRLNMIQRASEGNIYERALVIKNVKVKETDADGTENIIEADIKIRVPDITLGQSDIYPEYTRYALIADTGVDVGDGKENISINGNLYSGAGGISLSALNFNMRGSTLVNRGDLALYSSSNGTSAKFDVADIWVENIRTEKTTSSTNPVTFSAFGMNDVNMHVSNDLILNAPNSDVEVKGKYYGFSFNENNDGTSAASGEYSSAVLVNGKNSNLYMDLTGGLIAGRAFVSAKGAEQADNSASNGAIMLGQSMGIKSDQLAYMIPSEYLTNKKNPIVLNGEDTTDSEFALDAAHIENDAEREKIKSLVSNANPVTKRYYKMRGGSGLVLCYLFYNFKDAKAATTYYREYWVTSNPESIEKNAQNGGYVNSRIKMNPGASYLAGVVANVERGADGSLALRETPIKAYEKYMDLPATAQDSLDASFQSTAQSTAKTELRKYAGYQMRLMYDSTITIPGGSNRFKLKEDEEYRMFRQVVAGADYVNDIFKADGENTSFQNTEAPPSADYEGSGGSDLQIGSGTHENAKIIHVKYDGTNWATIYLFYNPDTAVDLSTTGWFSGNANGRESKGIVVAYGDVNIGSDFEGMIICGGKATFSNANVTLTADEVLVQSIFNKIKADGDKYKILKYFAGFSEEGGGTRREKSILNVGAGFSYENWKKTED